jgi:Erg28 like protein
MWQIVVAATALFNTVQNFVTLHFTKRLYNNVPAAHPGILSAHHPVALRLILNSSNAIAGAYIWDLDIDCVRSAVVCRVRHSQ